MNTTAEPAQLKGVNAEALEAYVARVQADPTQADRDPVATATWVGGEQAYVRWASGANPISIGGENEPSAMSVILGALAACDVDLIANRAALLGVELEQLSVTATGHFNVRRYLGLDGHDPGYDRITYSVRIKAPNATDQQLGALREACERDSPVADTLRRSVEFSFAFEVG